MSCFVGLQQKRLKKKSFRSCFAFEEVSGGVKWAGHFAGNSREKAPDLWECLNSTSASCQAQYWRRDPLAQGDQICQPHVLIPMVRFQGHDALMLTHHDTIYNTTTASFGKLYTKYADIMLVLCNSIQFQKWRIKRGSNPWITDLTKYRNLIHRLSAAKADCQSREVSDAIPALLCESGESVLKNLYKIEHEYVTD